MRRVRRIIFHLLALVSALLLIGALVMGFRSRGRYEAWIIAPQNAPLPAGYAQWKQAYASWEVANHVSRRGRSMLDHDFWIIDRRIMSESGTLIFIRQYMQPRGGRLNPNVTPGYHQQLLPQPTGPFIVQKTGAAGEHYISLLGLHYISHPPSMTITPLTPFRSPSPGPNSRLPTTIGGPSLYVGITELAVSWWWLAFAAAIAPVVWIVKFFRRLRVANPHACPACGYDIRATPQRCPECGACQPKKFNIRTDPLPKNL